MHGGGPGKDNQKEPLPKASGVCECPVKNSLRGRGAVFTKRQCPRKANAKNAIRAGRYLPRKEKRKKN